MSEKLHQLKFNKLIGSGALVTLLATAFLLYSQKKESANGRILIWKVSMEMIKDKPILGHGYGSFKAKYMHYQANYFLDNPKSNYSQLADNVKHPFNEFIKITVEYGIIGLSPILIITMLLIRRALKLNQKTKSLVLSGIVAILSFSLFSYPLQYAPIWLLLILYLSFLLPERKVEIRNTPFLISMKICSIGVCLILLGFTILRVKNELKWKVIATKFLQGNTKEMLPQ